MLINCVDVADIRQTFYLQLKVPVMKVISSKRSGLGRDG
jgi:hypothetical protein